MTTVAPEETKISLNDEIAKRVGGPPLVKVTKLSWFPRRDAVSGMATLSGCPENERKSVLESMRPTVIQIGENCPFDSQTKVVGIFEDDDEYRVFCVGPDKLVAFHLSRTSPIFALQQYEFAGFIDDIADEFIEVRDSISSAERERASVLEYGEAMLDVGPGEEPYTLTEFLADLKEGVHLSESSEDEDDDEGEVEVEENSKEPPKLSVVPTLPAT
jgi:hypothetical protein